MIWTPQDLPHLVAKNAQLGEVQVEHWTQVTPDQDRHAKEFVRVFASLAALAEVPLSWLDTDICDLVADTYASVPEWSPSACMPDESGLIGFETPPVTLHSHGPDGQHGDATLDAIGWITTGESVEIFGLSRAPGIRHILDPIFRPFPLVEVLAMSRPLNSTAGAGQGPDFKVRGWEADADTAEKNGLTFLSVVGTIWLLMSQPRIVKDSTTVVPKVRKSRPQPGKPSRGPVSVSVRHLTGTAPGAGKTGRGRKATTRWWVRGHWRQQPWGKGGALRKPIFITPHTAGARDAEVEDRPQVQVWRE